MRNELDTVMMEAGVIAEDILKHTQHPPAIAKAVFSEGMRIYKKQGATYQELLEMAARGLALAALSQKGLK